MKITTAARILAAMLLGVLYAMAAIHYGWAQFTNDWIAGIGEAFIRLLKLIAVPLVLVSVVTGVASLPDPQHLGRLGGKTLLAYCATTLLAIGLGIVLSVSLRPGHTVGERQQARNRLAYELWAQQAGVPLLDGKRLAEDAAFTSLATDVQAEQAQQPQGPGPLADKLAEKEKAQSKTGLNYLVDTLIPDNIFDALGDIRSLLKVIFFGILLGMALLFLPEAQATPLLSLMHSLNAALLLLIDWVMRLAPVFVFALIAGVIVPMADSLGALAKLLLSLLSFTGVALGGLLLLAFGLYPLLLGLATRQWQYAGFFRRIFPAQSMAFSSSSSAATLPVTLKCVTEELKVPPAIANFVLPIGSTVNMDGTSLYQTVCIIFLAQWHDIELSTAHYLLMAAMITLSSIGSAAVPSGGLVLMMVVLESMGLNAAWVGIILPMDRLLDMFRTVVNVTGDILVARVIAHSES